MRCKPSLPDADAVEVEVCGHFFSPILLLLSRLLVIFDASQNTDEREKSIEGANQIYPNVCTQHITITRQKWSLQISLGCIVVSIIICKQIKLAISSLNFLPLSHTSSSWAFFSALSVLLSTIALNLNNR